MRHLATIWSSKLHSELLHVHCATYESQYDILCRFIWESRWFLSNPVRPWDSWGTNRKWTEGFCQNILADICIGRRVKLSHYCNWVCNEGPLVTLNVFLVFYSECGEINHRFWALSCWWVDNSIDTIKSNLHAIYNELSNERGKNETRAFLLMMLPSILNRRMKCIIKWQHFLLFSIICQIFFFILSTFPPEII